MTCLLLSATIDDEHLTVLASDQDTRCGPKLAIRRWSKGAPPAVELDVPISIEQLRTETRAAFEQFLAIARAMKTEAQPPEPADETWEIE